MQFYFKIDFLIKSLNMVYQKIQNTNYLLVLEYILQNYKDIANDLLWRYIDFGRINITSK
jgi:hypothetical protein